MIMIYRDLLASNYTKIGNQRVAKSTLDHLHVAKIRLPLMWLLTIALAIGHQHWHVGFGKMCL